MNRSPTDYAEAAVTDLILVVTLLASCLVQGVNRPWKTPALTVDRRNELDREARAERLERSDVAPGESPAPLDLSVMAELVTILEAAEDLTRRACTAVGRTPPDPAGSVFADPRPYLQLVAQLLPDVAHSDTPQVLTLVQHRAQDLAEHARDTLGLVSDGQVLKALCPWCDGRTEAQPVGGQFTLRIRNVKGFDATVVTCEGGQCEPPPEDCGTWIRGKPAWLSSEWDWLAQRLDHHAAQSSA